MRQQSLLKRKAALTKLLTPAPESVLVVNHFDGEGVALFAAAVKLSLEGLVAKRKDSTYQAGVRSRDWLKIKRKGAVPPERFKRASKSV